MRRFLAMVVGSVVVSTAASAQTMEEIQRQLEALNERLQELERQNMELRERLEAAGAENPSKAPLVIESGREEVKVGVYGQINQALQVASDGERTQLNIVDNDASTSRLGVVGEAQVLDELAVSTNVELDFRVNRSTDVTNDGDIANPNGNVRFRKVEVAFAGPSWGKLWLGQGSRGADGIAEIDLSGTSVAAVFSDVNDLMGGYKFVNEAGGFGPEIGDVSDNLDGDRDPRIRYDTPALAGFEGSVSYAQESQYDVALRYEREFDVAGGAQVAGGIAYYAQPRSNAANADNQADTSTVVGSVSALHSTGFNFTVAGGTQNRDSTKSDPVDPPNPWYIYVKPGYQADLIDFGTTSFAVDYGRFQDFDADFDGGKMNTVGLGVVQKVDAAAMEVYASLRWHGFDDDADDDYKNAIGSFIGTRVKF
jgi:predicted porin/outer membrane murein-binding lipoprotein Lpp